MIAMTSGFSPLTSSGNIYLTTVNAGIAGVSGAISLKTGTASLGNSGMLMLSTGASTEGHGGDIELTVGQNDYKDGGDILLAAGNTTDTVSCTTHLLQIILTLTLTRSRFVHSRFVPAEKRRRQDSDHCWYGREQRPGRWRRRRAYHPPRWPSAR